MVIYPSHVPMSANCSPGISAGRVLFVRSPIHCSVLILQICMQCLKKVKEHPKYFSCNQNSDPHITFLLTFTETALSGLSLGLQRAAH